MLERMDSGSDDMTLGQLREKCQSEAGAQPDEGATGALRGRLSVDDINKLKPYTLIPHRPNYILLANYNSEGFNADPFRLTFNDPTIQLDDTEALFQISIKIPLAVDLFGKKIDIFGAYTNRSFWQVYNSDQSAPFRDTNHEPEAWIQFRPDWNILGLTNSANQLGIVHQSNGRGGLLSRSWNRVFANILLERDNFVLSLKPWVRIEEDEEDDDNPDIEDFLGYGEIRTAYKWHRNTFGLMFRNGFESDFDFTTFELSWSFPIFNYPHFRGYVQYFNGYGHSLVDYNQEVNSIGIGLSLTDYL
jgi:phospholipase A1